MLAETSEQRCFREEQERMWALVDQCVAAGQPELATQFVKGTITAEEVRVWLSAVEACGSGSA